MAKRGNNAMLNKRKFHLLSRSLLPVCALVLLGGISAFAQTSRISGALTDQQGNAIVGAKVQVINQESNAKKETTSDDKGAFAVPFLPAGNYLVTVEAPGFNPTTSQMIPLAVGQAYESNAQLTVEGTVSSVEVNAGNNAASIELGTGNLVTTLGEKEVTGIPLNGRSVVQMLTMAPGVGNQTGQDEGKVGLAGSAKFSVNGGRVEYNTFEVDGSDVLNTSINASRGQG